MRRLRTISAFAAVALTFLIRLPAVRADDSDALEDAGGQIHRLLQAHQNGRTQELAQEKEERDAAPVPVVLYETNDIHGHLDGAPVLATLLKSESRPHFWIDSGDWFQGTPEGNMTRGDALVAIFNKLGLTAGELGNHEYDYGEDNVRRLAAAARFPVLGSNISAGDGRAVDYVTPFFIREVLPNVKIGFFGLLTEDMPNLAFPKNIAGLTFGDGAAAARKMIAELHSRGATVVVAATHVGIENYGGKALGGSKGDLYVAGNAPGIDVILGGHTHTEMTEPVIVKGPGGAQTMITQTSGALKSVYRVVLWVNPKTGALVRDEGELIALDPARYPPDPEVQKMVDDDKKTVAVAMGRPLGSAATDILRGSPMSESVMGDWLTDVLRRKGGTDLAVVNTFGIRGDLHQGPVTFGDVYQVIPFDNRMVRVEIRGSELRKAVAKNIGKDVLFLQWSGLELVYDLSAPDGQRLKSLTVGGAPVDDVKIYTMTSMDFTVVAGMAFAGIDKKITELSPVLIRDVLVEEFEKGSPVSARLDGRASPVTPP
jgi:2',3'-cyclic-nucleotide 2'-phosphodiesterase (5'-nucleotidase family)